MGFYLPPNSNGWGTALGAAGAKSAINAVLDVQETPPLYPYTEPVTLQQVKDYCKIDFNDDDTLLTELITVAREELEKYCGISMVEKVLTVQLRNECGGIELPYGPTPYDIDVTLILDYNLQPVNPSWVSIRGGNFKQINMPLQWLQLTYTAGYGSAVPLPYAFYTAIKAYVFFLYQNRGEYLGESSGVRQYAASYIPDAALSLVNKYRRNFDFMGY